MLREIFDPHLTKQLVATYRIILAIQSKSMVYIAHTQTNCHAHLIIMLKGQEWDRNGTGRQLHEEHGLHNWWSDESRCSTMLKAFKIINGNSI